MMASANGGVLMTGIRVDLRNLHDQWMGLVFPRQRAAPHAVLGRWRPDQPAEKVSYYTWWLIGAPLVLFLYPLVLLGYITRFYTRRLDHAAARIGVLGVVLLCVLAWGALTAVAFVQLPWEGFIAVGAAAIVATVSAVLAYVFARVDGRVVTVLFAYPFAMNAIFLPPVVAALFSETMWAFVFHPSNALAIWILDTLLWVGGINEMLRAMFDLQEGLNLVAMWVGIAAPIGWMLGVVVTIADLVRPRRDDRASGSRATPEGGD